MAAVLVFLLVAATSCSRRLAPPVPKSSSAVKASIAAVLPPIPPRPKALLPIAFPNFDTGQIDSLEFSPDGHRLAFSYGADAAVTMWNLETGKLAWQRHVNSADGGPLIFDPHGRFLVVECYDPDSVEPIWICSLEGRLLRTLGSQDAHGNHPYGYHPPAHLERWGRFLVAKREDNLPPGKNSLTTDLKPQTEVWNTRTWHRVDHAATRPAQTITLTSTGHLTFHQASPPFHWPDPPTGESQFELSQGRCFIRLRGNYADRGTIEVFDQHSHRKLWAFRHNGDCPRAAAISPDKRTLAVATIDGYVEEWDLATGHLRYRTRCMDDVVRSVVYSPNGRVLAAAGGAYQSFNGIRLLDSRNGKLLAVLKAEFSGTGYEKDWTLTSPQWFAALPGSFYLAADKTVAKIRTPGHPRDTRLIARYSRPDKVRAALRSCYHRQ